MTTASPDPQDRASTPGNETAATNPTIYTVLLELEYSETVRPIDTGLSGDDRSLALGFRELCIICDKTGDELGRFNFCHKFSEGLNQIYGLYESEGWGTWSRGRRTAILLELPRAAPDGATVEFNHSVNENVLETVAVNITCNGQPALHAVLSGGSITFKIPPIVKFDELYSCCQNVSLDVNAAPDVSIAVLNCEGSALTIACVAAILKSVPRVSYEIVIVDNASSAKQVALLRSAHLPVRTVLLSENRGFGEGRNIAAETARGRFILFLSNDAFLTDGALDNLYEALSCDSEAGIVGPIFLNPDCTVQEMGGFVSLDGHTTVGGSDGTNTELTNFVETSVVDYISGACIMCRREEFFACGGFLPVFEPFYYEDVDLSLRFRGVGKFTKLVRDVTVYHIQHATTGTAPFKRMQELILATGRAGVHGLQAEVRKRVETLYEPAFYDTWQRLLSGSSSNEPASGSFRPAVNRSPPVSARAITVIGMHRSGTSAMTRVISLLGANLPQELMPPTGDNPTGFWEPKNTAELNDEILQMLGSSWDDILAFAPRRHLHALPATFMARARQQIRTNYVSKDLIVLKDPRISVLNGLWERALLSEGYEPSYVIMVRDPREVADSLFARNGFPRSKGLLLWASYMFAAEWDTRGARRAFVLYSDLLAQPEAVINRLEQALQLNFPRRTANALVDIEQFLRRDLRHHVFAGPWNAGAFKLLDEIYKALVIASRYGSVNSRIFSELEAWLNGLEQIVGPTFASLRLTDVAKNKA